MSEALRQGWTTDAFLDWKAAQPVRHQLVAGRPVMMAGGTQAHNTWSCRRSASPMAEIHDGLETGADQPSAG